LAINPREDLSVRRENALLVKVILSDAPMGDNPLMELTELARSAGANVVGYVVQRRRAYHAATCVGKGKLEEIRQRADVYDAHVIVFDNDLSPSQIREIEAATSRKVIDRSELILDIFASRARTHEARLQVELAQLEYTAPRLRGMWTHLERIAGAAGGTGAGIVGGIGTRGPGESQIEIDRRLADHRVTLLKRKLAEIDQRKVREVRTRQDQYTASLVGYTNAGKSTLFNQLTGAQVLQSPKMFATLDPKLRAIELPSRRKMLLSDTVGFIRNLPHTLVTSFRATLEEVAQAEVLLHIRDANSTYGEEQKTQVERVLGELDCLAKPRIEVLNKIDLLDEHERAGLLERSKAGAEVAVSARTGEGMEALLAAIDRALHSDPQLTAELRVPQQEGAVLAAIEAGMVVHSREYEGNLVRLTVSGPASLIGRLRRYRLRDESAKETP
jgi:GTP-binding protein HflX